MGVRIVKGEDYAVLYCSTTMWAFGPIFDDWEHAESFCQWWNRRNPARDLRLLDDAELQKARREWEVWSGDQLKFEEECRRCGQVFEKEEPEMAGTCEQCQRADWHEEENDAS